MECLFCSISCVDDMNVFPLVCQPLHDWAQKLLKAHFAQLLTVQTLLMRIFFKTKWINNSLLFEHSLCLSERNKMNIVNKRQENMFYFRFMRINSRHYKAQKKVKIIGENKTKKMFQFHLFRCGNEMKIVAVIIINIFCTTIISMIAPSPWLGCWRKTKRANLIKKLFVFFSFATITAWANVVHVFLLSTNSTASTLRWRNRNANEHANIVLKMFI